MGIKPSEIVSTDAPFGIPANTLYQLEKGERGAEVFGLQRGLNSIGWASLDEDGIFGDQTKNAVIRFQENRGLVADGIFGLASSTKLVFALIKRITVDVPDGLIRSLVEGESGNLIAAVNWSVPGGVDCSYCQRRVYEANYSDTDIVKRAFDGRYQMQLLGGSFKAHHDAYYGDPGAPSHETAWRLAILYHNYEYAADKIASVGVSHLDSYWTTEQDWVKSIGAHFADGVQVKTPLEWCKFYSLGAPEHNHNGIMVKYIKDWTV